MERITGIELVERKLDDLAIDRIVKDTGKVEGAVDLSKVKGHSNQNCAVLAVIAFKPTKTLVNNKELISIYLCDLKTTQTTARLLVDRTVFGVIMKSVQPPASVEGILLLILRPAVSIDTNNAGTLTFNVECQNQLAVVGRCKYFARCGAPKRQVGPNGAEMFCKLPIDSSLYTHCAYHTKDASTEQACVGTKRGIDSNVLASKLQVSDTGKVTNYLMKSTTSSNSSILNKEKELALNEQDDGDVAFALRNNTATVAALLGSAYSNANGSNSTSAATILNKADPLELRTAQKIIQTLALQQANANIAQRSAMKSTPGTSIPSAMNTVPAVSSVLPGGRIPERTVSALVQRAERVALARSGNQSNILGANNSSINYANQTVSSTHTNSAQSHSVSLPPSQAAMYANSSTKHAYLHGTNVLSSNGTNVNMGNKTTSGAYKLVGDTIINASNLARNAASISAPTTNKGTTNDNMNNRPVSVFHQLLNEPVNKKISSSDARTNALTQGAQLCARPSQSTAYATPVNTSNNTNRTTTTASTTTNSKTTSTLSNSTVNNKPTTTPSTAKSALETEIDLLLGRSSTHAAEADSDWSENFNQRMEVLAKREFAQTKAAEVQSIEISAFKCLQCEGRLTQEFPLLCHNNQHTVQKIPAVKRFFECGQCGKREHSLTARKDLSTKVVLPPEIRCLTCGAFRWRPCGQRGSGPLSVSVRDNIGGNKSVEGNQLILSASEWTKRGDNVSMAERVATLK
eukprot:gene11924-13831_t